jgi:hypothetical protein
MGLREIKPNEYQQIVGKLIYLTHISLDLS